MLSSVVRLTSLSQCIETFSHLYKKLELKRNKKRKKKSVLSSAFRFQSSMKQEVICEGPPLKVCVFHSRPLKHNLNCTEGCSS